MKIMMFKSIWLKAFGRHLWRHFVADRCFEAAGSLSYKTLIALVPLMAVMIGIVSSFGFFEHWIVQVESYIFTHFVPTKGDEIQAYLNQFVGRTATLTASGSLFLLIIAVLLMATIERSFNRIWRVSRDRPWLNRVLMYWAVLTLGPILLGASLALSSYFAWPSSLAPEAFQSAITQFVEVLTPFLIAWLGFTLLFMIVPHRRVYLRHAAIGGLVSAGLFEIAKVAFVVYLAYSTTYQHLYGTLAILPIFLVWIYVIWVVVLLGASLTAALTTFNVTEFSWRWSKSLEFILLLRILDHLWEAQRAGQTLGLEALNRKEPGATSQQVQALVDHLAKHHLVHFDENNQLILSADLAEWSIADLYASGDFVLPIYGLDQLDPRDPLNGRMMAFFSELNEQQELMTHSLKRVITQAALESK